MAIERWEKDENGEHFPVYTEEQAQRIARAAWGVHQLLPHPDDEPGWAAQIREFHRAMTTDPPPTAVPNESEGEK